MTRQKRPRVRLQGLRLGLVLGALPGAHPYVRSEAEFLFCFFLIEELSEVILYSTDKWLSEEFHLWGLFPGPVQWRKLNEVFLP